MPDQDRRMLLAIVLSLGVYLLWFGSFGPKPIEDPATGIVEQESTSVDDSSLSTDDSTSTTPSPSQTVEPEVENSAQPARASFEATQIDPAAAHAQPMEGKFETVIEGTAEDRGSWTLEVHSNNGSPRSIVLGDYTTAPEYHSLWGHGFDAITGEETPEGGWSPYTGAIDSHSLISDDGALVVAGSGELGDDGAGFADGTEIGAYQVDSIDGVIEAKGETAQGLHITKRYTKSSEPYSIRVEVEFQNNSDETLERLWIGVADRMSGSAGRFISGVRPNANVDESIETIYEIEDLAADEKEVFSGPVSWFGIGDRYFMSVLIPDEVPTGKLVMDTLPGGRSGSFVIYDEPLGAGKSRTFTYTAYIGPKSLDVLAPMGPEMEKAVEFGWFGVFSKPLLWLLKNLYSVVGNWGVAIILLTLLIKLLFFRLTQKTYESSQRMQVLQPQLKEIKEKFKDNKELQTQETMKLFKENNVNPMGSCLPMLLQLPVWFALYNTMLYSVELYNTSFLVFEDLTAPDPFGVLPTLYIFLMVGQQRMMPMASMDPTQRKVMKMMPLVFGFFMYTFPSGLVLYFCVNMMLTILQQWIIKKNLKELPEAQTAG